MSEFKLGPNQEKWLAALESGEYQQGKGKLECEGKFCCLGVANSCLDLGVYPEAGYLGDGNDAWKELGLKGSAGEFYDTSVTHSKEENTYEVGGVPSTCLTWANDHFATFAEIAAFIRANPEVVFKESK